jgi:small subunit ribosomal protein S1
MSEKQIDLPAEGTAVPASSQTASPKEEPQAGALTAEDSDAAEQSDTEEVEPVEPVGEATEEIAGDVESVEPVGEATEEIAGDVEAAEVEAADESVVEGADQGAEPAGEAAEAVEVEAADESVVEGADQGAEPAGEAAEEAAEAEESPVDEAEAGFMDDEAIFEEALGRDIRVFKENELVEGTVVSVDIEGALVDIGFKSEGLIPANELSIRKNVDPRQIVAVGDQVEGVVLTREDENGRPILSKKRAQYKRAWTKVEEVHKDGKSVKGTVIEVVKGGLIVDIGLRGFLPASLVGLRRVCNLHPFVDSEIEAKVIELDRQRNNVVLSRRAFLEEEQAEERDSFMNLLVEGEIREGTVSSVVPFGAFVDLGKMDGLVHVSELAWTHISHPSEVVEVGAKVVVKVLEVDRDRERISLSIRQTLEDPWSVFSQANEVGTIIEGKVTKTVPFGAFVAIGDGVEGLVHVSEIAMHRVESPEMELSIGQTISVKITELDTNRRRVSLSVKQALPEWKSRSQPRSRPRREEQPRPPREKPEPERRSVRVDSSLEAILEELKKRGIGGR